VTERAARGFHEAEAFGVRRPGGWFLLVAVEGVRIASLDCVNQAVVGLEHFIREDFGLDAARVEPRGPMFAARARMECESAKISWKAQKTAKNRI
jgi:hypothetical protein